MNEAEIAQTIASIVREMAGKKEETPAVPAAFEKPAPAAEPLHRHADGHVCKCGKRMSLAIAKALCEEVEREAVKRGMKIVAAVCDAGGNPVCVHCMDDAYIASYDVAVNKAFTSVSLQMPTSKLAALAAPGGPLYGIQFTNGGKLVIFGGGEPLYYNEKMIGGFGLSGGTLEEDTALGEFARDRFKEVISCL